MNAVLILSNIDPSTITILPTLNTTSLVLKGILVTRVLFVYTQIGNKTTNRTNDFYISNS